MSLSVFDAEDMKRALLDQDDEEPDERVSFGDVYGRQLQYARERAEKGFCERDLWDMESWFLRIIPEMLQEFKDTRHGSPGRLGENYVNGDGLLVNDKCHAEWDAILDEMIRLFREAREETCSRSNPYEEEHLAAMCGFEEKYGLFGQKLNPDPDPAAPGVTAHFMSEIPEYREIDGKWTRAERELEAYRADCMRQAMALFTQWLPDLVD